MPRPALFTSTSIRPNRSSAACTSRRTSARPVTSATTAVARAAAPRRHLFQFRLPPRGEHERRPARGKQFGERRADSPAGAGDHDDFVGHCAPSGLRLTPCGSRPALESQARTGSAQRANSRSAELSPARRTGPRLASRHWSPRWPFSPLPILPPAASCSTVPLMRTRSLVLFVLLVGLGLAVSAQRTVKPVLHGRHWVAITGKPLGATAGAMIFQKGGNAVDAACAMLGGRLHDVGHAQLGRRDAGAHLQPEDGEGHRDQRASASPRPAPRRSSSAARAWPIRPSTGRSPPSRPGTPGGLMTMLAEFGTMSLKEVLAPAIQMADGYPIEQQAADRIERDKGEIKKWPSVGEGLPDAPGRGARGAGAGRDLPAARSRGHAAQAGRGRAAGAQGRARAARRRSTPRTTASTRATSRAEFVRGSREQGGLHHRREDLANWKVHIEEPVVTDYKGIDVYKLTSVGAGAGDAAGAQHARADRPEGDGLQQRRATSTRSTR